MVTLVKCYTGVSSSGRVALISCRAIQSSVFEVPHKCYPDMLKKITRDTQSFIKTLHVVGTIHNAIRGSISANFYTDKWPDFSALVGQIIFPRISDKCDIVSYSTSSENMCKLLKEKNLITVGKRQTFIYLNEESLEAVTQLLSKSVQVQSSSYHISYLPPSVTESALEVRCPDGYFIKRLDPCHADFIRSYWPYYGGWPNISSMFENCIRNFPSAAVFSDEDKSHPVAWNMQYAYSEIGHGYALENHRGKGLGLAMLAALCKTVRETSPGVLPWGTFAEGSTSFLEKLGFVSNYEYKNYILDISPQ